MKSYKELFVALKKSTGASVKFDQTGQAKGSYSPSENIIRLTPGMSEAQTIKTLIHEMTHAELHSNSQAKFGDSTYQRQEFEAESVAYVMCNHFGLDASDYSFGYLSNWGMDEMSLNLLEETMTTVQKQVNKMIDKVEQELEKTKEKSVPQNLLQADIERMKSKQAENSVSKKEVNSQAKKGTII